MPDLTNRFGISALSKRRYSEAINEEIVIDKNSGQISVKNADGVFSSYDESTRTQLMAEKLRNRIVNFYDDNSFSHLGNTLINRAALNVIELCKADNSVEDEMRFPLVSKEAETLISSNGAQGFTFNLIKEGTNNKAGLISLYFDVSYYKTITQVVNTAQVKALKEISPKDITVEMVLVVTNEGGTTNNNITFTAKLGALNNNLEWKTPEDIGGVEFPQWEKGNFITGIKSIKFTPNITDTTIIIHNIYAFGFITPIGGVQPLMNLAPSRYDILPILSSAIKEHLNDYDPTKTYNKGDEIYHYDNGKYQFLLAKENGITGAFNANKWESAPKGYVPGLKAGKTGVGRPLAFIRVYDDIQSSINAMNNTIDAGTYVPQSTDIVLEYED